MDSNIYAGKPIYYLNKCYSPVRATIIKLENENNITWIENEHGQVLKIKDMVLNEFNKIISHSLVDVDKFLACPCGSTHFSYCLETKKLVCVTCHAEYTNEDINMFHSVDKKNETHIIDSNKLN